MKKAKRRTICQWAKCFGIKVMDPDGFDRKDINLYSRYFTQAEFDKGIWRSTIMFKNKGKMAKEIRKNGGVA